MKTAYLLSIITCSFFNCLLAQNSWAPDPNFGDNGITRIDFGPNFNDSPNDILLLPDGRILTAGRSTSSYDYFIAMSQLLPNGQPDTSGFGTNGEVLLHFVLRDQANDIELQPDGKILIAGTEAIGNGSSQVTPAIYRFESDGSLDTTFADSGKAVHRFSGNLAGEMYGVKVLSDGRILTAGFRTGSGAFGLMRFMPNGERDFSFGSNGEAVLPAATTFHPVGCLFLGDTAVVLSTVAFTSGMTQFVLGMMDSSGNPVPTFGNNGLVLTGIEGKYNYSGGESLSLTSDNKLILAGTTPDSGPARFSVFRFALNGTIDSTFGTDGRTDIILSSSDVCYDMKIDQNGKILLVGSSSGGYGSAGVARLNPDGSPDTTFASGGKFTINLNEDMGTHYLTNCVPLDNGDILAAGWDFASNSGDFMIVKLTQNPTGINDENSSLPENFELLQNYPNPFNPSTTIEYTLLAESNVKISVFNILGEKVRELVNTQMSAGTHNINFNASNLASGIYIYKIETKTLTGEGNFTAAKKMILLR